MTARQSGHWWARLTTFEPALLRAVLTAVVIVGGVVGLDLSGIADDIDVAWSAIFALIPLLQGWWTRTATTPTATVVEQATPTGQVIAGPANDLVPPGDVVRTIDSTGGTAA